MGDVLSMIRGGLLSFRGPGALVKTFVITAPGVADGLETRTAILNWNVTAPARWTALNSRVMGHVSRRHGAGVCVLLARWWEFQKRGALHAHVDLPYESLAEKQAADLYLKKLRQWARVYGFGYVRETFRPMSREQAAGNYAGGYIRGGHGKLPLREAVKLATFPRQPVHVSNRLKARALCSMRELRLARFLHVLGVGRDDARRVLHWLRVERLRIPTGRRDRHGRIVSRKMTWREALTYLRVPFDPQPLLD